MLKGLLSFATGPSSTIIMASSLKMSLQASDAWDMQRLGGYRTIVQPLEDSFVHFSPVKNKLKERLCGLFLFKIIPSSMEFTIVG